MGYWDFTNFPSLSYQTLVTVGFFGGTAETKKVNEYNEISKINIKIKKQINAKISLLVFTLN